MFNTQTIGGHLLTGRETIGFRSSERIFVNVYRNTNGQYECGRACVREWESSAFAGPNRVYRIRIYPKNPASTAEGGAA